MDSVKVEGIRYKKSSESTYPVTLVTNDSMVVEIEYECIDTGVSLGKLIVYSNDHYGGVDTMEITGELELTGIEERREPWAKNLEPCALGCEPEIQIQMQSQYLIWNTTDKGTLTVYDISGREVIKEESKASETHKTDIRHLKNGIYFIKLKDDKKTITKKILIIK